MLKIIAVIHKENESPREILAKYFDIKEMTEEEIQKYCIFEDYTDEFLKEYETGKTEKYKKDDSPILYDKNDKALSSMFLPSQIKRMELSCNVGNLIEDFKAFKNDLIFNPENGLYQLFCPDAHNAKKLLIKNKEIYTLDEFAEYKGLTKYKNKYGKLYNPNSKITYSVFGGSAAGILKLKPDKSGVYGMPGMFGCKQENDGEHCAHARIENIDFSPDKTAYENAIEDWNNNIVPDSQNPNREFKIGMRLYPIPPSFIIRRFETAEKYAYCMSTLRTLVVITPDKEWHQCPDYTFDRYLELCKSNQENTMFEEAKKWDEEYLTFFTKEDPKLCVSVFETMF